MRQRRETALWEWLLGDATEKYRMTDPWILTTTSAVVIAVALVACIMPARTASALDPVAALRHE